MTAITYNYESIRERLSNSFTEIDLLKQNISQQIPTSYLLAQTLHNIKYNGEMIDKISAILKELSREYSHLPEEPSEATVILLGKIQSNWSKFLEMSKTYDSLTHDALKPIFHIYNAIDHLYTKYDLSQEEVEDMLILNISNGNVSYTNRLLTTYSDRISQDIKTLAFTIIFTIRSTIHNRSIQTTQTLLTELLLGKFFDDIDQEEKIHAFEHAVETDNLRLLNVLLDKCYFSLSNQDKNKITIKKIIELYKLAISEQSFTIIQYFNSEFFPLLKQTKYQEEIKNLQKELLY